MHHCALNFDGVGLVEAAAVLFEMFEELDGGDYFVEGLIILEFFVPRLVDDGANEVDAFSVRGDVEVAVVAESLVDHFFFANFGGGGVPGDRVVIHAESERDWVGTGVEGDVVRLRSDDAP